ncbi:MAG TPA: hypothetical protein VHM26_07510 [Chitinophagaceae bacterium]|jgi:hypothetical protein|nr:hypothetical protein [Chitinophagaceae bacterium]
MIRTIGILLLAVVAACNTTKTAGVINKKVTLSSFTASEDYRLIDTLKVNLLPAYIERERRLMPDSLDALEVLLSDIKSNGTEDVTKCFIPRHSINYYENDTLKKFVLVCFECDGIKFSDYGSSTVKSEERRAEQMQKLKKYFGL